MSKCRGCLAEIVWGVTAAGKRVPLDLPEKRYVQAASGRFEIRPTWLSHHATCPEADKFRKIKDLRRPT